MDKGILITYMSKKTSKISALVGLFLALVTNNVYSAAFAVYDQSATYTGNAYAGTSSLVQDASTSYYNPAGLKYLDRDQLVLSAVHSKASVLLYDATALSNGGLTVTGINPSKPTTNFLVPGLNSAIQLGERVAFGFSVVELFASNLKYESDSIGRYAATNTIISTIDISPSLGVMLISNTLYIGAALDLMKTNLEFSSALGWGGGLESNGFVQTYMNDWSTGYHIGLLYNCNDNFRMGLVYFSKFTANLSGEVYSLRTLADFGTPDKVTSQIIFPERINYSVTVSSLDYFDLMAEIEWTRWSRLKTMNFDYNSIALPGFINFNFENTWRFSLGLDFQMFDMMIFKCGLAYDQTPVNDRFKNIRVPETNAYIAGLGLSFDFTDWLSIVAAYNHVFMNDFDIAETSATESLSSSPNVASGTTLNGKMKNSINKFGLQLVLTLP